MQSGLAARPAAEQVWALEPEAKLTCGPRSGLSGRVVEEPSASSLA